MNYITYISGALSAAWRGRRIGGKPGRPRPAPRAIMRTAASLPERSCRMDLNYSPEESAFRDEVRAWIRAHLADELRDKVLNYREPSKDDLLGWHRTLAKKGWV